MSNRPSLRLFVSSPLQHGAAVPLEEGQVHYLNTVMRASTGDEIALFNGRDGEWRARLDDLGKRRATAVAVDCLRPQDSERAGDLWLLFAPLKKDATDMVVEKATELGASCLQPVLTRYTNTSRVNTDRFLANATEAAEQCERLTVPTICPPERLETLLEGWDRRRILLVMDETGGGASIADVLATAGSGPAAILVGPEGGFEKSELDLLRRYPFVTRINLGPRILRAETAALAALTCWQALCGDWRSRPAFRSA